MRRACDGEPLRPLAEAHRSCAERLYVGPSAGRPREARRRLGEGPASAAAAPARGHDVLFATVRWRLLGGRRPPTPSLLTVRRSVCTVAVLPSCAAVWRGGGDLARRRSGPAWRARANGGLGNKRHRQSSGTMPPSAGRVHRSSAPGQRRRVAGGRARAGGGAPVLFLVHKPAAQDPSSFYDLVARGAGNPTADRPAVWLSSPAAGGAQVTWRRWC
ncbi:hypothetical protein BS78_09G172300 [Paspalum vaginatum]|nr:hypothetical protein BS78_09G172300 [Paspalum vaginatum]